MTRTLTRRRRAALWFLASALSSTAAVAMGSADASAAGTSAATSPAPAFTASRVLTRTHLVDGKDVEVDRRTFTVSVDRTDGLRDRQGIQVSWTGAHPTGGIVFDEKKPHAADAEYPVVILQCRGVDSPTAPATARLSQETCFTGTWDTRLFPDYRGDFPPPRLDRYATPAERVHTVGAPDKLPPSCVVGGQFSRYVPFLAADGTRYYGGSLGCAGLAPEQSVVPNPLNPASATWARTLSDGTGTSRFIVQDDADNASLGCSSRVACSLVIIPIEGISCDPAGTGLPDEDRPPADDQAAAAKECESNGFYTPGTPNSEQNVSSDSSSKYAVNGRLWWSASNWRNRVSVPLTFAPSAASCSLTSAASPLNIYGSEVVAQAVQQWAPSFCSDPKLFPLQQAETPEVQAKNLLSTGLSNGKYLGVQGIYQAGPPAAPFTNPVVQAPTAISGWGIGLVVDNRQSKQVYTLRLNARLLAKLLSMSYPALVGIRDEWASDDQWSRYKPLSRNPINITADPEFKALNPELNNLNDVPTWSTTTLYSLASDTDVVTALTSYINADQDARAWLDGSPDPWGMEVNPNYRGIKLPVTSWPLLDKFLYGIGCGALEPVFPLIAAPVSSPDLLAFNLQYGISNSQTKCVQYGDTYNDTRRVAEGPEDPGTRFILGVVSLADAARFGIPLAQLQTAVSPNASDKPADPSGRTFVTADDESLLRAARLMQPDDMLGTWTLPYSQLFTPSAADAYPGTLLVSTDIPTRGLDPAIAKKFAAFLSFVSGPGQVRGASNGQLATGYVPLTSPGLSAFVSYDKSARSAVAEQNGFVPTPSNPTAGLPARGSTGGQTGRDGSTGADAPGGETSGPELGGSTSVGTTGFTSGGNTPVGATGGTSSVGTSGQNDAAVGRTLKASVSLTNSALPLLVLIAIGCGALGLWTSGALTTLRRPHA